MMTLVKDYAEQIRGVSYKPEDVCEELNDESITLLRANNITDSGLCFDDLVYVRRNKVKDVQKLQKGDVLICTSSGSKALVGKAAYVTKDMDMTFGAFCKVIRPHGVNTDYFQYFFQSPAYRKKISELAAGANINNIRNEHIDGLAFYLPDISTQQRIADTLDKVSEGIEVCRKMLEKLEVMVQSRFKEMMDSAELGDETTVEKITERVKVGFVGTCEKYYTDEKGIPMIRTGNITNHGIDMRNLKYVTSEFNKRNMKSQIHNGDLLIARHGSNGQASVYEGSEAQCLNAVVIVPNQTVAKSRFLAELINSPAIKEQINRTLVGSTQNVVNTKSIANLTIRIPSLKLQEEYESYVEKIDKTKLTIQKILDKMELEKLALMQEYFG